MHHDNVLSGKTDPITGVECPDNKVSGERIEGNDRAQSNEAGQIDTLTANIPRVGVGALVIREGTVLLVQRASAPHAGLWTVPGGKLGWGETLEQAAVREVFEETGVQVIPGEPVFLMQLLAVDSGFHYLIVDLVCRYQTGELVAASDAKQAAWIPLDKLSSLPVEPQTLRLVNAYRQGELPGFSAPVQVLNNA